MHFAWPPQPWPRTGPGSAKDGQQVRSVGLRSDLLRSTSRAGHGGRTCWHLCIRDALRRLQPSSDCDARQHRGHPFHAANNVNDIAITSIVDYQVLPLDARVEALEQTYIRKVIDTVHDLPNVLYEVANESSGQTADSVVLPDGSAVETPIGDSTQWQYWVINSVKDYEREMGYDPHPSA